ncbi:MAG TPA: RNA polymerase sigma factor [Polyangiaceae bacterium]|nr:RNA polymerase sigma factor [Polyangiaceae bacterium]
MTAGSISPPIGIQLAEVDFLRRSRASKPGASQAGMGGASQAGASQPSLGPAGVGDAAVLPTLAREQAPRGEAQERERTEGNPLRARLDGLMERYVDGDPSAFEELYRGVSPTLFGYLLRLTRDRHRAEDLLQITFSKVHRARGSYLRGAPVLPWLLAIARRSFLDERRHAQTRTEDLSPDGNLPEPHSEERAVSTDLSEALERALDGLPEAYREAIQLTKISGLSLTDAASVLNTTETAVKLRVHRGYEQLRKQLERFNRNA